MSFRKILFITNNFPPATCGVGDYTYKLAKVLAQHGIEVSVLCASKPKIIGSVDDFKNEGIEVLPIVKSWSKNGLSTLMKDLGPTRYEWVSLQYVPFSFQAKGIPLGLTNGLKRLFPNVKWHVMFHELWVGKVSTISLRLKIHGFIQKLLIKNMLMVLNPDVIHSHSEIYLFQIEQMGMVAKKLPLISNIDLNELVERNAVDNEKVVFSIFGGIINGAPIHDFLSELNELLRVHKNKKIEFNFLGNNGCNLSFWIRELDSLGIVRHVHGFLSERKISEILSESDYGITTTPYLLIEKSGAIAAMKQHGLKIICVSRNWQLPSFDRGRIKENMIKEYKKHNLEQILFSDWKPSDYKDANTIGLKLVKDLNYQ